MPESNFFDERTEQSEVKTEIVRKYFWAWAKIISKQVKRIGRDKIGYVDLFAGPGKYKDGSRSTPLLILEGAIRDKDIGKMLVTHFNDVNSDNIESLESEIAGISNIKLLKHYPKITNTQITDELVTQYEGKNTIPTLFFLDPCGYKGISLRLIQAMIKSWGCDCMFFFNYNRINAALSNPALAAPIDAFFGKDRADKLRGQIRGKSVEERESIILKTLKDYLAELGGTYSIEYFFKDENSRKTSHFLIFVTKHPLGYDIMKSIMASESSEIKDGVAKIGYDPRDLVGQGSLFDGVMSPLDELGEDLRAHFEGRTLSVRELYYEHHVGRNYVRKNYQDVLRKLESDGKIMVDPPYDQRRKIGNQTTFSENVIVTFPIK